jgi:hypothetical protein
MYTNAPIEMKMKPKVTSGLGGSRRQVPRRLCDANAMVCATSHKPSNICATHNTGTSHCCATSHKPSKKCDANNTTICQCCATSVTHNNTPLLSITFFLCVVQRRTTAYIGIVFFSTACATYMSHKSHNLSGLVSHPFRLGRFASAWTPVSA